MKRLLALAVLTLSTAASANFYTGNDLLERLNDPARDYFAMGYIAGVSDLGLREYHCPPSTVTLGQMPLVRTSRLPLTGRRRSENRNRPSR